MNAYLAFLAGNSRWLAGGFLMCFCSAFGQTFFIALSGGRIRDEYGLSHGEFGSLYMMATLGSAMTLPVFGRIVDRLSVSGTMLVVAPGLALACALMSLSHSVLLLGLTIYLLRLFGQGMMTHTAMTAMGRWFTHHRGRAVALATLGMQTSEALLPVVMVVLFAGIGWRQTWLVGAVFIVVLALPAIFVLMRQERTPEVMTGARLRHPVHQWTREQVLADPLFWLMLIGVLAPGFIGTTIFFHQAYLLELRNWPAQAFASAFVVMALMTTTFSQVAGWLIDRFSAVRVLPAFLLPLSLACFALAAIEQPWGIFVFMGLLGVSYGISSTLFGALWPEVYGTRHLGSVRSMTVALMVLSSALGPGVTGLLIDAGVSYTSQMVTMGMYCVTVATVMIWISRRLVRRQAHAMHSTQASRGKRSRRRERGP